MPREFIIQRYASGMWPCVRGLRPFVVTGPSFKDWMVPGSLSRVGRWLLRPEIMRTIESVFPVGRTHRDDRLALADMLLADGIVTALWSVDSPDCVAIADRRPIALEAIASETVGGFIGESSDSFHMASELAWGLGTLSGPETANSYVAEDGLTLEAMSSASSSITS